MKVKNKKALVVEDNKHTRFLVSAILQTLGFKVLEAEDGEVAQQILSDENNTNDLDAVFLDVLMPKVNGLELLAWIKNKDEICKIPVLMLTTRDMAEDLIEGYGQGADYYISKPFTKDQIVFGLNLLLDGSTKNESVA